MASLGGPGYDFIVRVRDAFLGEDRLVLKSPNESLHIKLTQTTLFIDQTQYVPATLPHDLLPRTLQVARRVAAASGASCGDFVCMGRLIVLGRERPSHLAVEVKPVTPEALHMFRANIGLALRHAMMKEAEANPEILSYEDGSSSLVGRGWKLSHRGYLERADHRTHVTLGVLRTGSKYIDASLCESLEKIVAFQGEFIESHSGNPNVFHETYLSAVLTAGDDAIVGNADVERVGKMELLKMYYMTYRTYLGRMAEHRRETCPVASHESVLAVMVKSSDPVEHFNAWSALVAADINESMKAFIAGAAIDAIRHHTRRHGVVEANIGMIGNEPASEVASGAASDTTSSNEAGKAAVSEATSEATGETHQDIRDVLKNAPVSALLIRVRDITGDVVDLSNVNLRSALPVSLYTY